MIWFLFVISSEEDSQLVNELFAEYNKELLRVAMRIVRNKDDAEDALQSGFLNIINNLQKIRKISRPEMIRFCT